MLFVLGMEYLSRIMCEVGQREGFKYHDRCSHLRLNHLCFADDLLLFCNGDYVSIYMMMQGIKLFVATSGLYPNEIKSTIFCSGMKEEVVGRILEVTGYKRATLPFKYLGIPICSKKLSMDECNEVIEKMVARIRSWTTRNVPGNNLRWLKFI